MNDNDDVAMQNRCVKCLTEHYAFAVIAVSYGEIACPHCEHLSKRMTREEYYEALSKAREARQERWMTPPRQRRGSE
jgi:DNA-directed RNA polymerase subunit RPC12/RpoP